MSTFKIVKPKLYLDVDGVILPFAQPDNASLPFEMKPANDLEYYSPEVVGRLGKTCLDLAWCTTWESKALEELVNKMDALHNGRQLVLPDPIDGVNRISQKLDAIVADQAKNPSPFAWADDAITAEESGKVSRIFSETPHIIVQPDKTLGLSEAQLLAIEGFSRTFDPTTK